MLDRPAARAALLLLLFLAACGARHPQGTKPARVVADFSGGSVTLRGSLPDARSHDRLLERARNLYGQGHVQDHLEVDSQVIDAPWIAGEALMLPLVDSGISDGQAIFDGHRLQLTGEVPTDTIRAQLSQRAARAAGEAYPVDNHLQVMR